jgi:hypothetical protein
LSDKRRAIIAARQHWRGFAAGGGGRKTVQPRLNKDVLLTLFSDI